MTSFNNCDKKVYFVLVIEGMANLLVLVIKLLVGFSTGSQAILADAVHSFTDMANNVVALVVLRLSVKPADREHPYGHRKFETVAVFFLAAFLTVFAFEFALSAIRNPAIEVRTSSTTVVLMVVVLLINIASACWQGIWANRLQSDILHADARHTFADVVTTMVVILGWQLSAMGYVLLDKVCTIGVAGLILYLAYSLFRRVIPILVDEYSVAPEELKERVREVPGVLSVDRVRSRWMGSLRAVDMVISVDATLSTKDSHAVSDQIEKRMENEFQVADISIHIEPFVEGRVDGREKKSSK